MDEKLKETMLCIWNKVIEAKRIFCQLKLKFGKCNKCYNKNETFGNHWINESLYFIFSRLFFFLNSSFLPSFFLFYNEKKKTKIFWKYFLIPFPFPLFNFYMIVYTLHATTFNIIRIIVTLSYYIKSFHFFYFSLTDIFFLLL